MVTSTLTMTHRADANADPTSAEMQPEKADDPPERVGAAKAGTTRVRLIIAAEIDTVSHHRLDLAPGFKSAEGAPDSNRIRWLGGT
jgi:hypothetical protein